jgi:hypothetical protein
MRASCNKIVIFPPGCDKAVVRIHGILVWIRIRGSMPLTNRSGFGSGYCYFRHCLQDANKKKSQNNRNQGISYYFCMIIEGSGAGSLPLTNGSVSRSRRPKNIHTDPTDPDPQHCDKEQRKMKSFLPGAVCSQWRGRWARVWGRRCTWRCPDFPELDSRRPPKR